jgi:hypothetical protein
MVVAVQGSTAFAEKWSNIAGHQAVSIVVGG